MGHFTSLYVSLVAVVVGFIMLWRGGSSEALYVFICEHRPVSG